jgi:hypothetical protein
MSILSALQRTPEQDQATEEALADNRKAATRKAELEKENERLHLQVGKERRKLAEASFENNEAAAETAQQHLSVLANKIAATEAAIVVAEERIAEAAKHLHLANVAGWLRTARRLINKRSKYAAELTAGLEQYLHARKKLMEANEQLSAGWPLPGLAVEGSICTASEIDNLIGVEALRIEGLNDVGSPRAPGTTNNPFLVLSDLVPLADRLQSANNLYVSTIENGGPNAPPAPIPALPDAPVPDADDDLLGGAIMTEAQVMSMMPKQQAVLIDNRSNKGGTDETAR